MGGGGKKKMEDHPFFIKFRKKSKRDPTSDDRDGENGFVSVVTMIK